MVAFPPEPGVTIAAAGPARRRDAGRRHPPEPPGDPPAAAPARPHPARPRRGHATRTWSRPRSAPPGSTALHRAERAKAETRLLLLGVVFILGFSTVAGRMALVSAAVPVEPRGGVRGEPIHAQRADIVDRTGAHPRHQHRHRLALCPAGGDDRSAGARPTGWRRSSPTSTPGELYAEFTDGRKFLWIKRSISPEQRQRVHDLGEPGLLFGPRETRLYPNGAVAAHVLGGASFGREGVDAAEVIGTAGVERVFDARLRDPAQTGEPLRLSIDLEVQTGARGRAGAGRGGDARQGRGRHPDGGRHRPDPGAGEPARLRPEPPAAAADQGRPGRQPAVQPGGAGALRARLGVQAVHGGDGARGAGWSRRRRWSTRKSPMRYGRFTIRDFHNYGRAADRRGRAGEVLQHRRRAHRHDARAPRGSRRSSRRSGCSTPRRSSSARRRGRRRCCRRAGPTSRR